MERESFSSRLGFILISAGCAIGLGNVWRFPFITGLYGGASFVLIYLCFLLLLGLPIMVAEFAVGRASVRSAAKSFDVLEPAGTKWHLYKYGAIAGNVLLMMFYTTVSGWMLYYFYKMAVGGFVGLDAKGVGNVFGSLLSDPVTMAGNMIIIVLSCFGVCYLGVKAGVERITKNMMACLLLLMLILAVNSITLPNSAAGLKYYLYPDFNRVLEHGIREVVFAAMGQAFFTLSLGIGALAIFGSYIGKEQRLTGEAMWIMALDTFVAIVSGLIIFGLLQLRHQSRQRSEPAVHHPPQCVQRYERRPYLGYSVLPVHAFRSHVYSNRCIRKHYLLHLRFNRLGAQKNYSL